MTSSGQITISQPKLYGGRYKEGGIDGYFRSVLRRVGAGREQLPASAARNTAERLPRLILHRRSQAEPRRQQHLIRPIQPTVCCITAGGPMTHAGIPRPRSFPRTSQPGTAMTSIARAPAADLARLLVVACQDLSAGNASNKGVEAGGTLVLKSHTSGATFNATPVTLNTENNGAMYRNGATGNGWMNVADIAVQPLFPFTAGVWFNLHSQTEQILFKSNVGGPGVLARRRHLRRRHVTHQRGAGWTALAAAIACKHPPTLSPAPATTSSCCIATRGFPLWARLHR